MESIEKRTHTLISILFIGVVVLSGTVIIEGLMIKNLYDAMTLSIKVDQTQTENLGLLLDLIWEIHPESVPKDHDISTIPTSEVIP